MEYMNHPPEYVLARRVLLDALDALGPHRAAVILVGAQAIYLHTGDGDFAVAPMTTDADIALDPDRLADEPLLADALLAAGFTAAGDPGSWCGDRGVAVDLMVPEALSGTRGRRGARLKVHGHRVARRSLGLEPALVDNDPLEIGSLDGTDPRRHAISVAGPAALVVAKVIKIEERLSLPRRRQAKDGLDVLRLLQATDTDSLAGTVARLVTDPLAGAVTIAALQALHEHGRDPEGPLAMLAAEAVPDPNDAATVAASFAILVNDLITALEVPGLGRSPV